jgi:hypothetical protein
MYCMDQSALDMKRCMALQMLTCTNISPRDAQPRWYRVCSRQNLPRARYVAASCAFSRLYRDIVCTDYSCLNMHMHAQACTCLCITHSRKNSILGFLTRIQFWKYSESRVDLPIIIWPFALAHMSHAIACLVWNISSSRWSQSWDHRDHRELSMISILRSSRSSRALDDLNLVFHSLSMISIFIFIRLNKAQWLWLWLQMWPWPWASPGPPQSGKSSLLRYISGRLGTELHPDSKGELLFNGHEVNRRLLPRIAGYVSQTDQHAPSKHVYW